ncbi:carbon-nitrogen hydrolase family protein [Thalassotalea euphylliae]|uniref:Carbon-nitrogen hydrolase family protein n=1 Tax=Thalassotalea euphylliae TaxID=1655234 RepID=A0A3E0UJ70_9GAMM|nr:carbon-nitrogen hydrolase family protein [Thalassotalea euphylliae]REL36667.1 carbon-nitrogen hydrolase family protein [Thalassotalea euphylliae]
MAKQTVRLSAVQMCAMPDIDANLAQIAEQLTVLTSKDDSHAAASVTSNAEADHIVLLPECCLYFGGKEQDQLQLAHNAEQQAKIFQGLAALAERYQVYLLAGSLPTPAKTPDKFYNTSCLFSPQGELLGHYQKLHLFDVSVADNEKNYQESRYTAAGEQTSCIALPFAQLGLSICYDVRFPELYRQLAGQGADIITVPAAFTRVTGKAHWQTLLQARAIENQVYIIAAGQEGVHANGRETWGHSMIISPWGEILAEQEAGIGVISADFDPDLLAQVRNSIPVRQHNRFKTELIHDE